MLPNASQVLSAGAFQSKPCSFISFLSLMSLSKSVLKVADVLHLSFHLLWQFYSHPSMGVGHFIAKNSFSYLLFKSSTSLSCSLLNDSITDQWTSLRLTNSLLLTTSSNSTCFLSEEAAFLSSLSASFMDTLFLLSLSTSKLTLTGLKT